MKLSKRIYSWLIMCCMMVMLIGQNNIVINAATSFELEVEVNKGANNNKGAINLDWSSYSDNTSIFKGFQSTDGGKTWQTISLIDYSLVKEIKVLQVYPSTSAENQLKTWMETNGYGKDIIKVDSVYIDDFNTNPSNYLKKTNNEWNYDVLFFGTWDSNNSKDLVASSRDLVIEFIEDGCGAIFGHDAIRWDYKTDTPSSPLPYFATLAEYVNVTPNNYWGNGKNNLSTTVKITKKGIFTSYPWDIGEIGNTLTIPETHNVGQTAHGNIWLVNTNQTVFEENDPANFYLTTWNNCAMIQTGHSSGQATEDEQKIIANLIFYTYQISSSTYITDYSGMDTAVPNKPSVTINNGNKINVTLNATDTGSNYQYYIEAYDSVTGELKATSETANASVESGIKGYYYVIDNNKTNNFSTNTATYTESNTIELNYDNKQYLHVKTVDKAGNVSEVTTVSLLHNITFDAAGGELSTTTLPVYENNSQNSNVPGMIPVKTGHTFSGWYTSAGVQVYDQNGNNTNDGTYFKNNLYIYKNNLNLIAKYSVNNYNVKLIDMLTDKTTQLGTQTAKLYAYGTEAKGSDWGTTSPYDNTQYTYNYNSSSSVTVNGETTVYRYWTRTINKYNVTVVDMLTDKTTQLGTQTAKGYDFGDTAKGSDWGTTSPYDNVQYTYNYDSCSTVTVDGNETVYRYWTRTVNKYNVIYKDTVTNALGRVLGTKTESYDYGTEINPEDLGTDTTVGAYYTDYKYVGCSEPATVTENGAIVYRYFEYKTIQVGLDITVEEWHGEYDGQPHGITISSSIPNLKVMYGLQPGVYNLTSCPEFTNTGEYTVYYQISKEGYTPVEGSQTVKIVNKGANMVDVYATQASTFTVRIPKVIILDGKEGHGAYSIKVSGNIAGTDVITVTPESEFFMKQDGKEDIKTTVTQTGTDFSYANGVTETGTQTETGKIEMESISAGKWSGLFNFNITSSVDTKAEDSVGSVEEDILNETVIGQDTAQDKESEFDTLENEVKTAE